MRGDAIREVRGQRNGKQLGVFLTSDLHEPSGPGATFVGGAVDLSSPQKGHVQARSVRSGTQ